MKTNISQFPLTRPWLKKSVITGLLLLFFCLSPLFSAPCGDVNSSGTVDIVDALMTARYYVGLNPAGFDSAAADVNGDDLINIIDALQTAQYYVGLITVLEGCEPPSPTPTLFDNAWVPDPGNGTYKNPIIYADYSDPDVIRVGSDFYMTASSFNCVPGLPILHSKDLVNWTLIGHALQEQVPVNVFDIPQHAKGVWAPSLRYHDGQFWIFYGDPDYGVYMCKAANPAGPWEPPVLVKSAKGYIDTCPIWDDDGNAYLVHAWAKSRVGFNSILTLHRMKPDGTGLLDEGTKIFDGNNGVATTLEGPKFYKRNGYYYIFAPAGGVAEGWQVVLRSANIYGPYAIRTVMEQGSTNINGPHQGGYVELDSGESWFVHFQKVSPYGRLVHLNPMQWRSDDWPVIGSDPDGNGTGNPVSSYTKPDVGSTFPVQIPQTSDDFTSSALGLQWQWQANPKSGWLSLTARPGYLRLYAQPQPSSSANYFLAPNLLLQKLPARSFSVTTQVSLNADRDGERAGLIMMGYNYDYIALKRSSSNQVVITRVRCSNANGGGKESESDSVNLQGASAYLRVTVASGAGCQFSYGTDGQSFQNLGSGFTASEGGWIGAKLGVFSMAPYQSTGTGYADFDFFQFD